MLPSLFLSHGAPTVMVERESPGHHFLKGLGADLPRPKAILVISAHWETQDLRVAGGAKPETVHDFYGFPDELYEMRYPAPGDLDLSQRVAALTGAEIDPERGFDHGVWAPLMLVYPDADIPVVQLSLPKAKPASVYYELGQKLAVLRSEGVLIVGSGSANHNLRALRWFEDNPEDWATSFEDWLVERVEANDHRALLDAETQAPHFAKNHPSPEHWTPFYVALGAGSQGRTLHRGFEHKNLSMAGFRFD